MLASAARWIAYFPECTKQSEGVRGSLILRTPSVLYRQVAKGAPSAHALAASSSVYPARPILAAGTISPAQPVVSHTSLLQTPKSVGVLSMHAPAPLFAQTGPLAANSAVAALNPLRSSFLLKGGYRQPHLAAPAQLQNLQRVVAGSIAAPRLRKRRTPTARFRQTVLSMFAFVARSVVACFLMCGAARARQQGFAQDSYVEGIGSHSDRYCARNKTGGCTR